MLKIHRLEKGFYRADYEGHVVEFRNPEGGKWWSGAIDGQVKTIESTYRSVVWDIQLMLVTRPTEVISGEGKKILELEPKGENVLAVAGV